MSATMPSQSVATGPFSLDALPEDIRSQIVLEPSDVCPEPCWIVKPIRVKSKLTYATFRGRPGHAHKVVWRLLVGEMPEGKVPDHLCERKECANPAHLEPVTTGENTARYHASREIEKGRRNALPCSAAAYGWASWTPGQTRECPHCQSLFTPKRPWQRFCSGSCRYSDWLHGSGTDSARVRRQARRVPITEPARQKPLDFTPPTEPVLVLNPTAPKERKLHLQAACWRVLSRLEQGPATARELLDVGGFRYAARVDELRRYLRALCGYPVDDRSVNPILCSRPGHANPTFMLAGWAEPGNRPHRSEDGAETGGEG